MTRFEERLGVCLGGEYALEEYLGTAEDPSSPAAFYAAMNRSGERVLVTVLPNHAADGERRLMLWRRIMRLHHPNLLRLLDCGRDGAEPNGEGCFYAVLEWPDDNLSAALNQGPLGETEAREVLDAASGALRYLHAQGLVHGSLDPEHVVAVGSVIKLATDNLREPDAGEFTRAHDFGSLGTLLYRLLTGREPGNGADLVEISEPFAGMIRDLVQEESSGGSRARDVLAATEPANPEAPLPEMPAPAPLPSRRATDDGRPPLWAWPAALAVVALCLVLVLHKPAPTPPPVAPARSQVPPKTAPADLPAAPLVAAASPAAPVPPHERTVWRVIAYTYANSRDAQKMMLSLNRKWPAFGAEVFTPKGRDHPPYLVALGGRMSRLDAARVLQKARSRGLPHDTFMLNFSN